jgi:hypothetical protein
MRLPRVAKLLRLVRVSRVLESWERRLLHINFALFALLKFGALIFLCGHWGACVWLMVGMMGDPAQSWIGEYKQTRSPVFEYT